MLKHFNLRQSSDAARSLTGRPDKSPQAVPPKLGIKSIKQNLGKSRSVLKPRRNHAKPSKFQVPSKSARCTAKTRQGKSQLAVGPELRRIRH